MEKKKRLANLLGLQSPPSRANLVKDLVKYNVIQHVYPELQTLYHALEVDFQPLKLSGIVAPPMDFIRQKEDLQQYVPALEDTVIIRLLKQVSQTLFVELHPLAVPHAACLFQVSQVYQTISFTRFASLAPFADQHRLERVIVNAARTLDLQVRHDAWLCHAPSGVAWADCGFCSCVKCEQREIWMLCHLNLLPLFVRANAVGIV